METDERPVLAYAGPLVHAQRAWSALQGHGVEAWLLHQNAGSLYEYGDVRVTVRAVDRERAGEILRAMGLAKESQ